MGFGRVRKQLVRFVVLHGGRSQAGGVFLLVLEEFPVLDRSVIRLDEGVGP